MTTPSFDAYPSRDDLVDGMVGSVGCTERWYVVVSYSLDKLNHTLRKLWAQKVSAQKFSTTSQSEDQFTGEKITITWLLTLGAPTLQFSGDKNGTAILTMSTTGPVLSIPDDTFEFVAEVKLSGVQLKNGKPVDQTSTREVIRFADKTDTDAYIVFSFGTASSTYRIQAVPGSTAPVPSDFAVGLGGSLALWMQDPRHVNSIDIALATINNKAREGFSFLTPKAASFSVYGPTSSDKSTTVGCLSVYIQTQQANSLPGNPVRAFHLPGKNNALSYSIAEGYTASVIIKHDVFYNNFLQEQLPTLKNTNGRKIFREVLKAATNEGFQLYLRLDAGVAGDFWNQHWGGLRVEDVNWDLGRDQITLTIDKHAQQRWSYSFEDRLYWSEPPHGFWISWGRTYYTLWLKREAPLAIRNSDPASGTQILSQIAIERGNWGHWNHPWNPGPGDLGATSRIPQEVNDNLDSLVLPTFSASIGLDYTATTNVFAPGKSVTQFSSTHDMYAPYDILLLGNIIEPIGMQNPTLLEAMFTKIGISDDKQKSTADFVQDLIACMGKL